MKEKPNKYYLVGMPGIGKSYFLSLLKDVKHLTCMDLDACIESAYGSTIPDIIKTKGIEIFRLYEAITLRKLPLNDSPAVIACGGGTPCYHDNIDWINQTGISIYLHGSPSYLKHNYDKYQLSRPLLGDDDLGNYIDKLYNSRLDYYRQSRYTIDVQNEGSNVPNIINNLIER